MSRSIFVVGNYRMLRYSETGVICFLVQKRGTPGKLVLFLQFRLRHEVLDEDPFPLHPDESGLSFGHRGKGILTGSSYHPERNTVGRKRIHLSRLTLQYFLFMLIRWWVFCFGTVRTTRSVPHVAEGEMNIRVLGSSHYFRVS